MTTRTHNPPGAPCWADLWTSDVDGSRRFYGELFGWEANDPSPEFGGYFMFMREGVPVCGAMGDMGDMKANDSWKIYLDTDDAAKTAELAAARGASLVAPPSPVADLGIQLVLTDPTGAQVGAWQQGTFPGFTVVNEHGALSWCELFTRDFAGSLEFYRSVFRWETDTVGDTDEFRYATMRNPDGEGELAGVMDVSGFLAAGVPDHWSIYWEVDDAAASVAKVVALGGTVVDHVQDTPYGTLATVTDAAGAPFKLRTPPGR